MKLEPAANPLNPLNLWSKKRTVVSHRGTEGAEKISVESVKSVVKKENCVTNNYRKRCLNQRVKTGSVIYSWRASE